jgi:hypothetical protein
MDSARPDRAAPAARMRLPVRTSAVGSAGFGALALARRRSPTGSFAPRKGVKPTGRPRGGVGPRLRSTALRRSIGTFGRRPMIVARPATIERRRTAGAVGPSVLRLPIRPLYLRARPASAEHPPSRADRSEASFPHPSGRRPLVAAAPAADLFRTAGLGRPARKAPSVRPNAAHPGATAAPPATADPAPPRAPATSAAPATRSADERPVGPFRRILRALLGRERPTDNDPHHLPASFAFRSRSHPDHSLPAGQPLPTPGPTRRDRPPRMRRDGSPPPRPSRRSSGPGPCRDGPAPWPGRSPGARTCG